jgi:hypothetical protein
MRSGIIFMKSTVRIGLSARDDGIAVEARRPRRTPARRNPSAITGGDPVVAE